MSSKYQSPVKSLLGLDNSASEKLSKKNSFHSDTDSTASPGLEGGETPVTSKSLLEIRKKYSNLSAIREKLKSLKNTSLGSTSSSILDLNSVSSADDFQFPQKEVILLDSPDVQLQTAASAILEYLSMNSHLVFNLLGGSELDFGEASNIKKLSLVSGVGSILLGALKVNTQGGKNLSAVLSSDSVRTILPEIFNIARVARISGNNLNFNVFLRSVDEQTLAIKPDYCALGFLKAAGFQVLLPTNTQEAVDFSAFGLRASKHGPVANCFDGTIGLNQKSMTRPAKQLKKISPFEFYGKKTASTLLVVYGALSNVVVNYLRNQATRRAKRNVAVLVVKQFSPFLDEKFLKAFNVRATKKIFVVDFTSSLSLYKEVAACLAFNELTVQAPRLFSNYVDLTGVALDEKLASVLISRSLSSNKVEGTKLETNSAYINSEAVRYRLQLDLDLSSRLEEEFFEISIWRNISSVAQDEQLSAIGSSKDFQVTDFSDIASGREKIDIRLAKQSEYVYNYPITPISQADILIYDALKTGLGLGNLSSEIVHQVRPAGKIVFLVDFESETEEVQKLSLLREQVKDVIARQQLSVFLLNVNDVPDLQEGIAVGEVVNVLLNCTDNILEEVDTDLLLPNYISGHSLNDTDAGFHHRVKFTPNEHQDFEEKEEESEEIVDQTVKSYELAWSFLFPAILESKETLRPDEHEVATATVTKFERLTPSEYSRNIFHIEFDISGTGITYEIGDALGVFGLNEEEEVDAFIKDYKLDPDEIVKLPLKKGGFEYMTFRKACIQRLDLFGKVQKKFYIQLAQFALKNESFALGSKARYDHLKLMHTGTDDAEQFKLGGYETVTYAELLLQYQTCRMSSSDILRLVPMIKARHYSISSSMKMNPRSVHLLVVAVDWVTPLGKAGYGQCTRYLKNLRPGDRVTVDIQKSVLRLPPKPEQPIVMAGLGTGMAPFRAFIQQRYWQLQRGFKVGPIVLYFGARHKAQEWLYGNELEEYEKLGLVKLGLAWSRDQEHKVYIQHKIKEDADEGNLSKWLKEEKGYFYLCGPTWPVPDVRDALALGLDEANKGKSGADIDATIVEELKEEGRYILEVY
eukprot:augustus_masked-scaffold_5-processed-gene-9.45-mRNA-1 protein AED:0.31 eAED:0.32 QI:0/-1/0/1/-1/1/1/0/1089